MRASKSQALLRQRPDRSRSFRCLYSNEEMFNTRDITSIFHSPFKDGCKNKEYINPTFASSTLFYPQDYNLQEISDKSPKRNVVYNRNQIIKKQLYEKRMSKMDQNVSKAHEAVVKLQQTQKVAEDRKQNISRSRSRVKADKNEQLIWQLECLIKHRDNNDKKEKQRSRIMQESRGLTDITNSNIRTEAATPIYLQKNRQQMDDKTRDNNRKNLQEWMQISQEIKKMKDGRKKDSKKRQTEASRNYTNYNNHQNWNKEQESRKNAGLLANILKEQIRQCKEKQLKQRKSRFNF